MKYLKRRVCLRISILLLFLISLSACSNSSDIKDRAENKSDLKRAETTHDQSEADINAMNPNMIRNQTETSFRSIKSQANQKLKPLALPTPGYVEAEKK
jgi:hypothetical protein